jgi:hypothetical protein
MTKESSHTHVVVLLNLSAESFNTSIRLTTVLAAIDIRITLVFCVAQDRKLEASFVCLYFVECKASYLRHTLGIPITMSVTREKLFLFECLAVGSDGNLC